MPDTRPPDPMRLLACDLTDRLVYLLGTYPHLVETKIDIELIQRATGQGWRPHAPAAVTTLRTLLGRVSVLCLLTD